MANTKIFMVCTPYSFIIAYELAKKMSKKECDNILVLKEDFPIKWILDTLKSIENKEKVFKKIFVLKNTNFNTNSFIKNIINVLYNRIITIKIKFYYILESYLPNPYVPEFTNIASKSEKKILYEEGIGLFKDSENDIVISKYKIILKKILFGFGYTEVNKGINFLEYFDDYFLSSNKFSKNILIPHYHIPIKLNLNSLFHSFYESCFFNVIYEKHYLKELDNYDTIILLERSLEKGEIRGSIEKYNIFLKGISHHNNVFFKYHPREKKFIFGLPNHLTFLPVEIILGLLPNTKNIIGLNTSSIYNLKKINKDLNIYSVHSLLGYPEENINDLFINEGIILLKNINNLKL